MQISQEESGAITLTIPRSSLDETIEDEIDDERVDQLTSKVTFQHRCKIILRTEEHCFSDLSKERKSF